MVFLKNSECQQNVKSVIAISHRFALKLFAHAHTNCHFLYLFVNKTYKLIDILGSVCGVEASE